MKSVRLVKLRPDLSRPLLRTARPKSVQMFCLSVQWMIEPTQFKSPLNPPIQVIVGGGNPPAMAAVTCTIYRLEEIYETKSRKEVEECSPGKYFCVLDKEGLLYLLLSVPICTNWKES